MTVTQGTIARIVVGTFHLGIAFILPSIASWISAMIGAVILFTLLASYTAEVFAERRQVPVIASFVGDIPDYKTHSWMLEDEPVRELSTGKGTYVIAVDEYTIVDEKGHIYRWPVNTR